MHTTAFATVDLVVETRTYHIPGHGPRVEVNMALLAGSVTLGPNQRGFMQGQVETITVIERDGAIVDFAKTIIAGEERTDSIMTDILHQEHFDLPPGVYEISVEARDLLTMDTTTTRYRAPLVIGKLSDGISIADPLFAERMEPVADGSHSKFGYQVVPLISDYFPRGIDQLNFYTEVYGADKVFGTDSLYLLTYQLELLEEQRVVAPFKRSMRMAARPAEPVFASFDISNVPSGNYLAVIEVRDKRGELVARRDRMLQRNNPISVNYDPESLSQLDVTNSFMAHVTDRDTLMEYLRSLMPIADPLERKIIEDRWNDKDVEVMRRFFHGFWANRSTDPEKAWKEYQAQVVKVNQAFGCRVLRGYETDRGRVYLKYGAPNSMMDRFNEMDALPYTIWHYYRAGKYTNRRFVFYQPDLANNCMELIHSEVPGEVNNPRWNQIIHGRNNAFQNVDVMPVQQASGDRAREFFDLPR